MPSLGNFDPNQHHDTYEPLPAGDYLVMITESTIDVKEDGGQFVKVTMEVSQPEQHYGRKCFANFTLEHPNPKAVEVGRRILSNLCRAVGVMSPRETEELHGIPFFVRLTVEQWNDGSLHNEARAYWSTQAAPPPQSKPKAKAPAAPMGQPQYQPPRPGPAPGYQHPGAPQQRPQAPQGSWQQPQQSYGTPGGQRPPQGQQWQPSPSAGPWGQQPQYQPQAAPPPQQAYQPPAQPQAPQASAGPPPWAQAAPQPPQQQLPMEGDLSEETPF